MSSNDRLPGLRGRLNGRFAALLAAVLVPLIVSHIITNASIRAKEFDGTVLSIVGRQRMLLREYGRLIHRALVGLAISDWEPVLESQRKSAQTASLFESNLRGLIEGGTLRRTETDHTGVTIPPCAPPEIRDALHAVEQEWSKVKRAGLMALRSDVNALRNNEWVKGLEESSETAIAAMHYAVLLMEKDSMEKLHRVQVIGAIGVGTNIVLLLLAMLFVDRRIVLPLARLTRSKPRRTGRLGSPARQPRARSSCASRRKRRCVGASRSSGNSITELRRPHEPRASSWPT